MTTQPANNYSIQSYVNKNRNNIDEALVSLRVMKQIDDFLHYKCENNRELAKRLGYTESYVSQLMTGVKKVNCSFINKFEKEYKVEFDFKIKLFEEEKDKVFNKIQDSIINVIHININTITINHASYFEVKTSNKDYYEYEDAEFENV